MKYTHIKTRTETKVHVIGAFPTNTLTATQADDFYKHHLKTISELILELPLYNVLRVSNMGDRILDPIYVTIEGYEFTFYHGLHTLLAKLRAEKASLQTKAEYSAICAMKARKKAWREEEPDFVVLKLIPLNDTF